MRIPILIEPAYRRSVWCRQTLNGLFAEAKRKKYTLRFVPGDVDAEWDEEELFGGGARLMIVAGTSVSWIPQALRTLEKRQVRAILINYDSFAQPSSHSVVRMDYVNAMRRLMGYLYQAGRRRVALFGFNPNSSADRIKAQFFTGVLRARGDAAPDRHVFRNEGDLRACFARFLPVAGEYDALICANDLVAVSALRQLRGAGIAVPERLFLAGFGESVLAQRVYPSITTAILDHEEMGRQAVTLFAYMHRQRVPVTASVRVACKLAVRQSTQGIPEAAGLALAPEGEAASAVDFYRDAEVRALLEEEEFCFGLDELDWEILTLLAQGMPVEAVAERCQSTPSTVGYRIRQMQARAGADSRRALLERVARL